MASDAAPTADGPTFHLVLEGDGVRIDRDVSRDTALLVINAVMGGSPAGGALTHKPSGTPSHGASETEGNLDLDGESPEAVDLSPGEFIEQSKAKRNLDKIVALGEYLRQSGAEQFTSKEIEALFQAAGEPTPGNFSRDLNWAVRSKWVAQSPTSAKHFYVTGTGRKAVKEKFPPEMQKATTQSRGRTRKKKDSTDGSTQAGDE